jgi:3-deoxy-D-manno-oct-2-ulosonic acid (Kdo) hydroxylase
MEPDEKEISCPRFFAIYNTRPAHVPFTARVTGISSGIKVAFAMISQVRPLESDADATDTLEAGHVLWSSTPLFALTAPERPLLSSAVLARGKNVSFDAATGTVGGSALTGDAAGCLKAMLARFSDDAESLVARVFPAYRGRLQRGRTSFRPIEVAGRASSWRQDDTRLHLDSFPASPVRGQRILRVFANVNPEGRPRSWRIGEDFEAVGRRFAPQLRMPAPGTALLLRAFGITKSRRSAYDAMMLQLHDLMKADSAYQKDAPQTAFDFPAGSTWVAFTDQVSHAAMAGQYQLEQTLLLPVDAMRSPERSPLRILERLMARALI